MNLGFAAETLINFSYSFSLFDKYKLQLLKIKILVTMNCIYVIRYDIC